MDGSLKPSIKMLLCTQGHFPEEHMGPDVIKTQRDKYILHPVWTVWNSTHDVCRVKRKFSKLIKSQFVLIEVKYHLVLCETSQWRTSCQQHQHGRQICTNSSQLCVSMITCFLKLTNDLVNCVTVIQSFNENNVPWNKPDFASLYH